MVHVCLVLLACNPVIIIARDSGGVQLDNRCSFSWVIMTLKLDASVNVLFPSCLSCSCMNGKYGLFRNYHLGPLQFWAATTLHRECRRQTMPEAAATEWLWFRASGALRVSSSP